MDAILKEVEKCQVLCANCHAVITAHRKSVSMTHPHGDSSTHQSPDATQKSQQPEKGSDQ